MGVRERTTPRLADAPALDERRDRDFGEDLHGDVVGQSEDIGFAVVVVFFRWR